MEQIMIVAVALSVAITTLLEVFTQTTKGKVNRDFYPLIAPVIGVVVALVSLAIPEITFDISIPGLIVAGALSGLSASGFYDLAVRPIKDKNQD